MKALLALGASAIVATTAYASVTLRNSEYADWVIGYLVPREGGDTKRRAVVKIDRPNADLCIVMVREDCVMKWEAKSERFVLSRPLNVQLPPPDTWRQQ